MKLKGWVFWVILPIAIALLVAGSWYAYTHSPDLGIQRDKTTGCDHAFTRGDLPIMLYLDTSAAEREEDARAVVAFFNEQLGGEVLLYNGVVTEVDTGIVVSLTFNPKELPQATAGVDLEHRDHVWGSTTHLYKPGCRKVGAKIVLLGDPTRVPSADRRVFAHEVGHALGLSHDLSAVGRLMHPDDKFQAWEISIADRAALRASLGLDAK